LFLTAACLPVKWPLPPEWVSAVGQSILTAFGADASGWSGLVGSVVLTWSGVAMVVATAAILSRWTCWKLADNPCQPDTVLRRHAARRFYHLVGQLLVYGLALYALGWGWVVQGGAPEIEGALETLPGSEFLVLAPFLLGLVLSWACFYDADRAFHKAL